MIRRNNTNRKSPSFPKSPSESVRKPISRKNRRGQNVTEYLILVAGVLVVVILAASSRGIFTQGVNRAIGIMMNSVESIATEQCLTSADDVPGVWGSWSSWTPCASCSQTRTRACDSPAPRCNGAPCAGGNGLIETVSQACTGSGTWVVGSCGACAGACGSTTGTCSQIVSCSGGCCDPMTEPPSTIACTKSPYPDVWAEVNDWVCSVPCGTGTETQTVTCSGSCCDPATRPPATRSCTITCDDGDSCNGAETCNPLAGCQPGTPLVCDDGMLCNGVETCSSASGSCQPGTPPAVDDGIPCTTDYCDTGLNQVVHIPDNTVCGDGLFCNGAEYCDVSLGCQAGFAPALDDGVGCTIDTCDDGAGTVIHTPDNTACDNSLFCDGAEYCDALSDCQAGTAPVLNDGVSCTVDSCDEVNNIVVYTPNNNLCSDNNVCTGTETCNAVSGCQPGTPPVCDDGNVCNGTETCNAVSGCQAGTAPVCNDGNVCNGIETCNAVSGCQAGTPLVCSSDNLFCTGTESCNTSSGCVSSGNPCGAPAVCNEALDSCCGNGAVDGAEQCDWNGPNLNGQSCSNQGWGNGQLACSNTCQFNRSLCERQLCANQGGSWNSTCQCCQFFLSSCPASWQQYQNWSRTSSRYCPDPTSPSQCQYTSSCCSSGTGCFDKFGPNACVTGSHSFSNDLTIETCTIWARSHWYNSSNGWCYTNCSDDYVYGTCYATRSSVGCRYY